MYATAQNSTIALDIPRLVQMDMRRTLLMFDILFLTDLILIFFL
jgi:hypothetical protein